MQMKTSYFLCVSQLIAGTALATRTMETSTLHPATQCYITLPTLANPGKWMVTDLIYGDDFTGDANWDAGTVIRDLIIGDMFPEDVNWDNSIPSSGRYYFDESWA